MDQLDRIRDALARRPFQPITLKLTDGTLCRVTGPEWLIVPPVRRPREVALFQVPERGRPDEFYTQWQALEQVVEVLSDGPAWDDHERLPGR